MLTKEQIEERIIEVGQWIYDNKIDPMATISIGISLVASPIHWATLQDLEFAKKIAGDMQEQLDNAMALIFSPERNIN